MNTGAPRRPVPPSADRHWWATAIVGVALLALIVPSLVYLYPRGPFLLYGHLTAADVTGFERNGGAVGTTSTGEYYPLDVKDRPTTPLPSNLAVIGRLDRTALPPGSQVSFRGAFGYGERYDLSLPVATAVRFNLIRFAGWQVKIDGQPVATRSSSGQGLLLADAPAGSHRLTLSFVDTPVRRLGWIIALASALALAALALIFEWPRLRKLLAERKPKGGGAQEAPWDQAAASSRSGSPSPPAPSPTRGEGTAGETTLDRRGVVALGAGTLALLGLRALSPAPYAAIFARRSPPNRVIGVAHPAQVNLADQVEFLGYDLRNAITQPGGRVDVILYWRALRPLNRDYRSLAMIARVGDNGLLTQDDRVNPGGIPAHTWPTDRYFVDEHAIAIPANAPPMVYQLQVALYDPKTLAHLEQVGVAGWQGEQIILQQIHVARPSPIDRSAYRSLGDPVFGGAITLVGYRVSTDRPHPGQTLDLILVWRANRPLDHDYTVFTHLVDAGQKQVAGNDSKPLDGQYPTSTWLAGEDVVDTHRIALPANLPPGQYHLAFGLYDAKTLQRLDATEQGWNGPRNQIDLDDLPIHVVPPA